MGHEKIPSPRGNFFEAVSAVFLGFHEKAPAKTGELHRGIVRVQQDGGPGYRKTFGIENTAGQDAGRNLESQVGQALNFWLCRNFDVEQERIEAGLRNPHLRLAQGQLFDGEAAFRVELLGVHPLLLGIVVANHHATWRHFAGFGFDAAGEGRTILGKLSCLDRNQCTKPSGEQGGSGCTRGFHGRGTHQVPQLFANLYGLPSIWATLGAQRRAHIREAGEDTWTAE